MTVESNNATFNSARDVQGVAPCALMHGGLPAGLARSVIFPPLPGSLAALSFSVSFLRAIYVFHRSTALKEKGAPKGYFMIWKCQLASGPWRAARGVSLFRA